MPATEFPDNWQEEVTKALAEARKANPSVAVFGLNLPESWKCELQYYARNGELCRMFGVRGVAFGGKTISTLDAPAPKESLKSKKVK